jgi:hypothetical protein
MKTILALEPAGFLPIRFFAALSFAGQPANKAVAVAAVTFRNCLLFILPSLKKVQFQQPPDAILRVIVEVVLLYHAKLPYGKSTYGTHLLLSKINPFNLNFDLMVVVTTENSGIGRLIVVFL